jgi:hypothetical protein
VKKKTDIEKFWEEAELRDTKFREIVKQIELTSGQQIPVPNYDRKRIEADVAYVKGKTKEIEERLLAKIGELFESEKEREFLHISIRVSCDFHKFLLDFGDKPPLYEAEYVADTIRSGIDWFYSFAFHCRSIDDESAKAGFARQATSTFIELRSECLRLFQILCSPSATSGELLASLLSFIYLELAFVAQMFPFIFDSNPKEGRWLTHQT